MCLLGKMSTCSILQGLGPGTLARDSDKISKEQLHLQESWHLVRVSKLKTSRYLSMLTKYSISGQVSLLQQDATVRCKQEDAVTSLCVP